MKTSAGGFDRRYGMGEAESKPAPFQTKRVRHPKAGLVFAALDAAALVGPVEEPFELVAIFPA
jgi:hypothetical protein